MFPQAISNAETGIRNIPTFIEVIALRFAIKRVIKLTQHTTTKGLTFAIHPVGRFACETDDVLRHSGIKLLLYHPEACYD